MQGPRSKKNISAILGFEALWGLSAPFVMSTTVLPGYLDALGLSKLLIGLVPALFSGGIALIQPFSLYLIRSGPKRLDKMLWAYRIAGLCYIAMALSALLLPIGAVPLRTCTFFICLLGFVFTVGIGDPHYIATVMDSIDSGKRGWFFALRFVYSGVGGLIAGAIASRLLGMSNPPVNFALSMFAGGALVVASTFWFERFRYVKAAEPEPKPSISECLTGILRMIKGNRRFLLFLAAVNSFMMMQGAAVFIVLSIKTRLHAGDSVLGWLGSIEMAAAVLVPLVLGRVGDRFGYKRAFAVGTLFYLVGISLVMFGSGMVLFAGYFFAAVIWPTVIVAGFHLGYECSGEKDASKVYAGISISEAPFRMAAPLIAGAVVQRMGYMPVFAAAAAFALGVLVILSVMPKVTEKSTVVSQQPIVHDLSPVVSD